MIAVLCGGLGGARVLAGLAQLVPPRELTVIAGTGHHTSFFSLEVLPEIDAALYALTGELDLDRGWGIAGDTFRWRDAMRRFSDDVWLPIGDRDLALQLRRTRRIAEGASLLDTTVEARDALAVRANVLPATELPLDAAVETERGPLPLLRYAIDPGAHGPATGLHLDRAARPAPGVLDAMARADAVVIAAAGLPQGIELLLDLIDAPATIAPHARRTVAVVPDGERIAAVEALGCTVLSLPPARDASEAASLARAALEAVRWPP